MSVSMKGVSCTGSVREPSDTLERADAFAEGRVPSVCMISSGCQDVYASIHA